MLLFAGLSVFPVHALNETYTLTASPSRLQESTTARVLLSLNVSNSNTVVNYAFTWNVRDPTGALHSSSSNQTGNSHAASFVLSEAYPSKFNGSPTLAYVGVYSVWVNQTQPLVVGSTGVASGQFQVGLTDSLNYQRLSSVSIQTVGYASSANVTIKISGPSGMVSGFPLNKTTDSSGSLSYIWSIPVSLPVGAYTLTLSGLPVKTPPDIQSLTITATSVTISSLTVTKNLLQASQTEDFRFTAIYPNLAQVRTGSVILRILEGDGTTTHYVTMTYSTALAAFHGTFQIPLSGEAGPWVGTLDVNSFDDGYGNKGPSPSVIKPFTVTPAILTVSVSTQYNNYTVGGIVAIYASVVTPGAYNFTSGTVIATTSHGTSQIGSPLPLFYDQSRGKWVGSYSVNSTNPSGVWQILVIANDTYGNAGQGTTSTLVSIPTSPQQASTFSYLLIVGIAILLGLAILGSWIVFGRKRITRKVLKVDLEAVHAEAKKVEDQEFFKKIQEQLRQERTKDSPSR